MRPIKLLSFSLSLLLAGFLSISPADAQIKIGTNGAIIAPASLLELESANQGLLLPRMADTIAINALTPPNGMLIYLTKEPSVGLYVRKVTGWEYISGSLAGNARFNSLSVAGEVTAGTFRGPLLGNATSATTVSGNVAAVNGGTGQSLYNPGDILYASTSIALSKLPIGLPGRVLGVTAGGMPAWSTAGAGTVINVSGAANRISVTDPTVSPVIDIASTYAGQNSITTLGTVSTGIWNGTPVTATYGGTGLNTLPLGRVLVGNGIGTVASVNGDVADLVLTSNGPGLAPTFKAPGVGDMVLSVNQTVTGIKTFGGVGNVGKLVLAGNTSGTTILNGTAIGTGGTVVLPESGNLVSETGIQTLTNKTLTSPILITPSIGAASGTSLVLGGGTPLSTTNQTGTGSIVMSSGANLINPNIGTASGTSLNLSGSVTAAGGFVGNATSASNVGNRTGAFIASGVDLANAAVSTNTSGTIVIRDGSGGFSAGTITASLIGNVTGNITGNAASVTTNANLIGEATSVGNAVTLTNSAVIGKTLINYTTGTGAVGAGDNILQAIGKVEGNANLKAPINNPSFTGTVVIQNSPFTLGVTSVTTSGTQLNYLNAATGIIGTGSVVFSASPTFTGTPTLPTGTIGFTQIAGNNSTALATTAFVTDADNLKAPLASPTFTGTVTTPAFVISTVSTPTGSADPSGTVGEIRMDANYLYIKTAVGWKRTDLATF